MMKIALVIAMVALSGCASRSMDRVQTAHAVKYSAESPMSVAEMTACLARTVKMTPTIAATAERTEIAYIESGWTFGVLTLTPTKGGTLIERRGQPIIQTQAKACLPA